jgi:hypothetical protein
MNLSFFKYVSNFDASTQGAKALLTHTVKVEFLDIHDQFRNVKALTIMANKIRDVLEIEPEELYMKRLASSMITVGIHNINKLVRNICIPSMAKGATPNDTIPQKILYSSLPNQCQKCHQFGHFARACNIPRALIWDGSTPAHISPSWSERVAKGVAPTPLNQTVTSTHNKEKR